MAKPKSPLLSLGARGTIADTLTFQKRGRLTIARQKPIPTDPKSPAQLARRQIYRDAVDAWNALSLEEKEAYRGVCPGLTSYQCYMKTALVYVPPVPPPEEYTEEQLIGTHDTTIKGVNAPNSGQKLTISNRKVSKIAFYLKKNGNPTGDVTFIIYRVADDAILVSKLLGDASTLQPALTWEEVTLDSPTLINEEVRMCILHPDFAADDYISSRNEWEDVKPGERWTRGVVGAWSEAQDWDFVYRYKFYEP